MTASLYAALQVPDFPVAVLQRGERRSPPTVVACGRSTSRLVFSADATARSRGVCEGMALTTALARQALTDASGALRVLERDEDEEQRVQRQLLVLAESTTPRFEDVAPGLLVLDFRGLRDPYASAAGLAHGTAELGLGASVGVSANRFVALCAARTQKGVTHVYPGREAGFLHALPLSLLPLEAADLRTLACWGVRRIGELARLPEEQLAERFGERGARMARLARGEERALLRATRPQVRMDVSQEFDWEMGELEPLVERMSGLLVRLCHRLQGCGQAAASLTTRLQLADGGTFRRTIDLPYPLSDARALLALVRIDLAAHPPGASVTGVRLAARPTESRPVQGSLFASNLPSPERLAVTLARLAVLVGSGRVGAPAVVDTHRPSAAALDAFRPAIGGTRTGRGTPAVPGGSTVPPASGCPGRSPLAFRCFRPSRPAAVTLDRDRPVRVEAGRARGPVTACAGPWHVSGEWWTSQGWQYREWDVEVGGSLYRVCCEASTGKWLLVGEYD